jgi:hypothetical protein
MTGTGNWFPGTIQMDGLGHPARTILAVTSSIARDSSSTVVQSMPSPNLRISEADWRNLRRLLDGSFRSELHEERGCLVLLGENRSTVHPSFSVAEVILPEEGEVRPTSGGLVFNSRYLRRTHLQMRNRGLAGIGTFHTHPFSDESVMFSRTIDDVEDPKLIANLVEIEPKTKLVSVVLGRRSQAGRVWTSPDNMQQLSQLVVVGGGPQ